MIMKAAEAAGALAYATAPAKTDGTAVVAAQVR